jgi:hypothetical protein
MTAPLRHLPPGATVAARRSGRLHRALRSARGLPAALAAYRADAVASAVAAPGLFPMAAGWNVREVRIGWMVSRYSFRRAEGRS